MKPLSEYLKDKRKLPSCPWVGIFKDQAQDYQNSIFNILRMIHHWRIIDTPTLISLTGYSRKTVRLAIERLKKTNDIRCLGRRKSVVENSLYWVPMSRDSLQRRTMPFFHASRTTFSKKEKNEGVTGGQYVQVGDTMVRLHTLMIPKCVAWVLENGLDYRVVPLSEANLRTEFGWYSHNSVTNQMQSIFFGKPSAPHKSTPKLVLDSIPDAYLVDHSFGLRVEYELTQKSSSRYEDLFSHIPAGDYVFMITHGNLHLFQLLRQMVEDNDYPVSVIRYGHKEDLAQAVNRLEALMPSFPPSLYRSKIVEWYSPVTLDRSLHDEVV